MIKLCIIISIIFVANSFMYSLTAYKQLQCIKSQGRAEAWAAYEGCVERSRDYSNTVKRSDYKEIKGEKDAFKNF